MSIVVNSDASYAAQIAHRLQVAFDLRDLSAASVSDDLGISAAAVRKWLRTGKVRIENLIDFSDLYSLNLEWLIAGRGPATSGDSGNYPASISSIPVLPIAACSIFSDGTLDYSASDGLAPSSKEEGGGDVAFRVMNTGFGASIPPGSLFICSTSRPSAVGDVVVGVMQREENSFELVVREKVEPSLGEVRFQSRDSRFPDVPSPFFQPIATALETRIPSPPM